MRHPGLTAPPPGLILIHPVTLKSSAHGEIVSRAERGKTIGKRRRLRVDRSTIGRRGVASG